MITRVAILLVLISLWRPVHGQSATTNMNMCIDNCFGLACSAYPSGSSSRSACQDRCIEFNCKKMVKVWGAIAYSKTDGGWGYAMEVEGEGDARKVAMENCRKHGSNCVVETVFRNTCGAVAAAGDRTGWGTGGTREAAEKRALSECQADGGKGCEVKTWVCSAPNGNGAVAAPPAPPPPPRAVSWGAIAYSAADMSAGYSQGKDDRASAEKEAMAKCAQRGRSCQLRTAFNKQCGALAADRNFEGWGTSTNQREAQQKAVDECRKAGGTRCALHILFCSM